MPFLPVPLHTRGDPQNAPGVCGRGRCRARFTSALRARSLLPSTPRNSNQQFEDEYLFLKMSTTGLMCFPSKISFCVPHAGESSLLHGRVLHFSYNLGGLKGREKLLFSSERRRSAHLLQRYPLQQTSKVAMNASFGDMDDDTNAIFPRINVRDPYKRLGISREASEEEIQAARNFLINKYAAHKPSVDAIESAHDKIILQSLLERRSPKINVKKKLREMTQLRAVKAITSRFQAPSRIFIIKTTVAFIALGILTVLFPTEEGPTLQVAISLLVSIYFIHERLQSRIRAFLYGTGAFVFSWLLGTFLMVSVVPPLLQGLRSLEVTTSLISYILLWVSSTYLK